ncbi:MAG: HNH endonuclease, partial [Crenarchaeota archaeon]|nr:HNH endonuclease [Thermoproteota archaeon]
VDYCNQAYSNKQKDIHKFDELFNQKNVKPLVDTYVNEKELLPFLCLVHNIEVKKSIARLKRINIICQECMNEYRRNLYQEDESVVFSEFKKHNLIILDNEKYVNSKTPIKCICEYHPDIVQEIAYYNLKFSYGRCRLCIVEGRRGENNPNWKGGITSENHKNRASEEYIEWRNKVYERDNYTCQCCGDSTGGNLQAHHIENFSTNEELRFDINNGITLCDLCHNPNKHGSFHNIYGTYNNNKNQLVEYINKYNNGEFETIRLKT